MTTAISYGLRLKLDLETIAAPPSWWIQQNPNARMIDQNDNITGANVISYWYPGLQALIHSKSDALLSILSSEGILPSVDFVLASLGQEDEPIYPPSYELPAGAAAPGFWWYDQYAQADFPVKMAAKYQTIGALNAAWGTSYASFASVKTPVPGTVKGTEWADTLNWYRDTKRAFIAWQIADTQALVRKYAPTNPPPVEIIVPGQHTPAAQMASDIANGVATDPQLIQFEDTEFLVDTAASLGAYVHVTGMPESEELQYIRSYMTAHGYKTQLTGEIVNLSGVGANTAEMASEVLANDLVGFDYLYGTDLYNADTITPNSLMALVKKMQLSLANAAGLVRQNLTLAQNFNLTLNACLDVSPGSTETRLCLSSTGRPLLTRGPIVLWTVATPVQSCPQGVAWYQTCHATFQGDGNFVLYNGNQPYWSTGTSSLSLGVPTQLVASATAPYLSLLTQSNVVIWNSSSGRLY